MCEPHFWCYTQINGQINHFRLQGNVKTNNGQLKFLTIIQLHNISRYIEPKTQCEIALISYLKSAAITYSNTVVCKVGLQSTQRRSTRRTSTENCFCTGAKQFRQAFQLQVRNFLDKRL